MNPTIAIVTSSRADYGHLYWPLRELQRRGSVHTPLLVTGAHLSPEFGRTVAVIERDGFPIADRIECLLSSDTEAAMGKAIGLATLGFVDALDRLQPDAIVVIADRFEMMAPATAAMTLRIPIVHIEGGEASEGAIDHVIRNALTAMAHVHLTPTELASARVVAMGEEPWRVHQTGAPSLDHLAKSPLLDRAAVEDRLGHEVSSDTILVGYHPVTLDSDSTAGADPLYAALERTSRPLLFCYPNADAGSRRLIERARAFVADGRGHVHTNLDPILYWSLLRIVGAMVGNSSSGIMESPSVGIPAVNLGRRQAGRERADGILDVPEDADAITAALDRAFTSEFRRIAAAAGNPYGDGHAAERIADILESLPDRDRLLAKPAMPDPRSAALSRP